MTMISTSANVLAALPLYALTCCMPGSDEKTQERYYKASDVQALLDALGTTPAQLPLAAGDWHEPKSVLDAAAIPPKGRQVLAQLTNGNYSVVCLTWAARWLTSGGAVLLFQEVVRWQFIAPAQPDGKECNACGGLGCPTCHGGTNGKGLAHA